MRANSVTIGTSLDDDDDDASPGEGEGVAASIARRVSRALAVRRARDGYSQLWFRTAHHPTAGVTSR